jgi:hypothetical protein
VLVVQLAWQLAASYTFISQLLTNFQTAPAFLLLLHQSTALNKANTVLTLELLLNIDFVRNGGRGNGKCSIHYTDRNDLITKGCLDRCAKRPKKSRR